MMFSSDDAFMDITQSHTIGISKDVEVPADISLGDYDVLVDSTERAMTFAADKRSVDMPLSVMKDMADGSAAQPAGINMEKKTSSVPCFDLVFEDLIASLSKSNGPRGNVVNTTITPGGASSEVAKSSLVQNTTQLAGVDKENQVSASAAAALENSLVSRNTGQLCFRSSDDPEDNPSTNITEAPTGCALGSTDDDFFQCIFPTQEMYSKFDKKISLMSEMKSKQPQRSMMLSSTDIKGTEVS